MGSWHDLSSFEDSLDCISWFMHEHIVIPFIDHYDFPGKGPRKLSFITTSRARVRGNYAVYLWCIFYENIRRACTIISSWFKVMIACMMYDGWKEVSCFEIFKERMFDETRERFYELCFMVLRWDWFVTVRVIARDFTLDFYKNYIYTVTMRALDSVGQRWLLTLTSLGRYAGVPDESTDITITEMIRRRTGWVEVEYFGPFAPYTMKIWIWYFSLWFWNDSYALLSHPYGGIFMTSWLWFLTVLHVLNHGFDEN